MMQLTNPDVLEFQDMCREHLGLELSWEDAQDQAINLVRLVQLVHRPMTAEEFEAVQLLDKTSVTKDENYNEQSNTPEN